MLCIKLVNCLDKYTEMHGQQNVKKLKKNTNYILPLCILVKYMPKFTVTDFTDGCSTVKRITKISVLKHRLVTNSKRMVHRHGCKVRSYM